MVTRPIGYDLWVYYVNFQSSLIVICGDQGPPNFCLHGAASMLRPALKINLNESLVVNCLVNFSTCYVTFIE